MAAVAARVPRAEIEGEMGDSHVGLQARLMSQALRKLTSTVSRSNTLIIFINQIRMKIGVMFGNPETTPGGRALKFFSSVRLDIRRIDTHKDSHGNAIGNRVRVKVVKNKVAPPFKQCEFDIMYGEGISRVGEIVDLGVKLDVIDKAGAWYTCNGQRIQGRDGVKEYLANNEEVRERIAQEIYDNAWKLSPRGRKEAESAAAKAVNVSADDFDEG